MGDANNDLGTGLFGMWLDRLSQATRIQSSGAEGFRFIYADQTQDGERTWRTCKRLSKRQQRLYFGKGRAGNQNADFIRHPLLLQ
jgi:hypothetical protein